MGLQIFPNDLKDYSSWVGLEVTYDFSSLRLEAKATTKGEGFIERIFAANEFVEKEEILRYYKPTLVQYNSEQQNLIIQRLFCVKVGRMVIQKTKDIETGQEEKEEKYVIIPQRLWQFVNLLIK